VTVAVGFHHLDDDSLDASPQRLLGRLTASLRRARRHRRRAVVRLRGGLGAASRGRRRPLGRGRSGRGRRRRRAVREGNAPRQDDRVTAEGLGTARTRVVVGRVVRCPGAVGVGPGARRAGDDDRIREVWQVHLTRRARRQVTVNWVRTTMTVLCADVVVHRTPMVRLLLLLLLFLFLTTVMMRMPVSRIGGDRIARSAAMALSRLGVGRRRTQHQPYDFGQARLYVIVVEVSRGGSTCRGPGAVLRAAASCRVAGVRRTVADVHDIRILLFFDRRKSLGGRVRVPSPALVSLTRLHIVPLRSDIRSGQRLASRRVPIIFLSTQLTLRRVRDDGNSARDRVSFDVFVAVTGAEVLAGRFQAIGGRSVR